MADDDLTQEDPRCLTCGELEEDCQCPDGFDSDEHAADDEDEDEFDDEDEDEFDDDDLDEDEEEDY